MSLIHTDTDIADLRDEQADAYEAMWRKPDLFAAAVLVLAVLALVVGVL